ncbi:hypothetical protein [Streptomyces sp. NPDC008092]|uniref:hypothetical protein n=1 Tax=Streptomyces sp. NPDC008092 TaxID=3364808 RepID=UPI0036E77F6F
MASAVGHLLKVFVSSAVPRVPMALVEQLARRGVVLVTVGTSSPSWPALAVITFNTAIAWNP